MPIDSSLADILVWLVTAQFAAYALSWLLCAVMMREERAVMLHWASFLGASGLGFWLKAQRGDDASWLYYVVNNMAFMLGSLLLWRGICLFLGQRQHFREIAAVGAVAIIGAMLIGPAHENGVQRVLWTYGALAWITMRMGMTTVPPAASRFGWRVALASLALSAFLLFSHLKSFAAQLADTSLVLEQRLGSQSGRALLAYLAMAAVFNLGFMGMSLGSLLSRFRHLADRDGLTGLPNRRTMERRLDQTWSLWRRRGTAFSLLILDLDHFKQINDGFGHEAGDRVLTAVAQRLQAHARTTDDVARWGGEEFVVLLPGSSPHEAEHAAERLRAALAAAPVDVGAQVLNVSASFGVATVTGADTDVASVIARADAALYRAKAGGRNRVERAVMVAV